MRLPSRLLVAVALVGSAIAMPFKLPFFGDDAELPNAEPGYNIAPLLSSTNAAVIPDRYVVVLKKDLHPDTVRSHGLWVAESCHHYSKHAKRDSVGAFFTGVKRFFSVGDSFQGYAGHFDDNVLEQIRSHPDVAYVERDMILHTFNERFAQHHVPSWGLSRVSHRAKPSPKEYEEYDYDSIAGEGVVAYIIDTGVNVDHEDFEGRAIWGKTIPENDGDVDGNGHGSHVAGTVAGKSFGIAKKATIKAVKVLSSNGSGTLSDVIAGIEWAVQDHQQRESEAAATAAAEEPNPLKKKPKKPTPAPEPEPEPPRKPASKVKSVANMSLGGGRSRALDRAVDAAVEAGIHFAVAAGNDASDACRYSPAASELAVTVGATTIDDSVAWFSNHGPCVDVFAPGRDITSSWIGSSTATNTISGTSMASPHVCGLLALLLSEPEHGELNTTELKDLVIKLSTSGLIKGLPTYSPTVNKLIYNDPPSA
ncbi:hypothetical protein M427DRAFT_115414 [Gonapodya prolifera JEL478]|uniref:Subtilisin-like protein n=1 Tax=Gonapodya prolifera (strain JEL478) TaxID=1344416 RepID=A0A139A2I1_GONPJ|nr:hypothetical protein M427DRAFT_115414 [Gonapodya prolifera JEL478]|eukprot:KXS10972.1 hypothetical protein M427DRAFT_115414 [Gonapodya prolifera JEL478]